MRFTDLQNPRVWKQTAAPERLKAPQEEATEKLNERQYGALLPPSNIWIQVSYILIKYLHALSHTHAHMHTVENLVLITCTLVELWRFL